MTDKDFTVDDQQYALRTLYFSEADPEQIHHVKARTREQFGAMFIHSLLASPTRHITIEIQETDEPADFLRHQFTIRAIVHPVQYHRMVMPTEQALSAFYSNLLIEDLTPLAIKELRTRIKANLRHAIRQLRNWWSI